jgi:two-component system response regulator NreC
MGELGPMPARLYLASDPGPRSGRDSGAISVALAVDHDALRRSLRQLLDQDDEIEVIADPPDLAAVMESLAARPPRVLVIDLRLADGRDQETIRTLRTQSPDTEVVVVTMHESPLIAQQVIDAGAMGFVLKDRADSELPVAIRCAARGQEFVSSRVDAGLEAIRRAVSDGLSPRETEVVRLIALGHTSAEIAEMLSLSRRTVETQRARIYEKLGLTNRAGLVQFALRRRLIGC